MPPIHNSQAPVDSDATSYQHNIYHKRTLRTHSFLLSTTYVYTGTYDVPNESIDPPLVSVEICLSHSKCKQNLVEFKAILLDCIYISL